MSYVQNMDQKTLRKMIERRHPDYDRMRRHWEFLASTYAGGRDWFSKNIFRYHKEGDGEYSARQERAYRFNHTREVVDLVSKYIFRRTPSRNEADAPDEVKLFWRRATLGGETIETLMRRISDKTSIYGRLWVVVDSTFDAAATVADAMEQGGQIYAYLVSPQNVLDMSFDDRGELNWILIHETTRDDAEPFFATGEVRSRWRLWTRWEWYLYEMRKGRGVKEEIVLLDGDSHGLGVVPVFPVDHITTNESQYSAPSLVGDIAYLDRAVANYLSNLDAIIQDQTFSQLAMPAQNVMPGEEAYDKLLEMGTKRVFLYNGETGAKPEFLSPDPRQAALIITAIKQIINEIYHSVGMAGERTKQDNAQGIDNSSGVAKAYDFDRMNSLLSSKAITLERAELKLVEFVERWTGIYDLKDTTTLVEYPRDFDSRGLYDEFEIASQLGLIQAPDTLRREQMKTLIDKVLPMLSKDLKSRMEKELEDWPVDPMESERQSLLMKTSIQQDAKKASDTGTEK